MGKGVREGAYAQIVFGMVSIRLVRGPSDRTWEQREDGSVPDALHVHSLRQDPYGNAYWAPGCSWAEGSPEYALIAALLENQREEIDVS